MNSQSVDLYLGGPTGAWVLKQVKPVWIKNVLTLDEDVAKMAQCFGIQTFYGNANRIAFAPARIGLSVHYPRILKPSLLSMYHKVYNVHPGYLPGGRCYYPVFWALWENTPAGATLHQIDEGIDTGPIVDQIRVPHYPHDTGWTLYERVVEAEKELFDRWWPRIAAGEEIPTRPQEGEGTFHTKAEFFKLKRLEGWEYLHAKDLVRLIRCLSFPKYTGFEITIEKRCFEISMTPVEEGEDS